MLVEYATELYGALRSRRGWRRGHFVRFFPQRPTAIYAAMERAGFPSLSYRSAWPDLVAALASPNESPSHFVQFLEAEVKSPRLFRMDLDFVELGRLADLDIRSGFHKASLIRNLVQSAIDGNPDVVIEPAFWRGALTVLAKVGTPIVVAGDSHSRVFRQTIPWRGDVVTPINILCGGGSGSGLPKPVSRSGYGARLSKAAAAIQEARAVTGHRLPFAFGFGQVDVEFVFTYQSLKRRAFDFDEAGFEAFCDSVIAPFVAWVAELPGGDHPILGLHPPCIDDEFIREAYRAQMQTYIHAGVADMKEGDTFENLMADFDRLVLPDKGRRTAHHRLFNDKLRAEAKRRDAIYFDDFDRYLGADGRIDPKFACASDGRMLEIGRKGVDIHIGEKYAMAMQARFAREIVEGLGLIP